MNIFILDKDPKIAAQMHCDKHVIKMILESAQTLSNFMHHYKNAGFYKPTHLKHPCTLWVLESTANFLWLVKLIKALNEEYKFRYNNGDHKSYIKSRNGIAMTLKPIPCPQKVLTPFAQAMPDKYKSEDAVAAYRSYYIGEKARIATWRKRKPPEWWKVGQTEASGD